jgi:hypothetical protein
MVLSYSSIYILEEDLILGCEEDVGILLEDIKVSLGCKRILFHSVNFREDLREYPVPFYFGSYPFTLIGFIRK